MRMRPRKNNRHLPACMYFKHGRHWYVKNGRWQPLSVELAAALAEYARIVETPKGGMDQLIDRAFDAMKPNLSASTIKQYTYASRKLKTILTEFSPQQVKSKHVADIKVTLGNTPNMANRILSFLRIVFAYAVEWQLVEANPCIGVRRHAEHKRGRLISDDDYERIRAHAHPRLAAIMALQYLTGQRIGDVLRIRRADITDDGITFQQQKTGARLLVRMTPELRQSIDRAKAVDGENVRGLTLFHIRGRVPSYTGVRDLFERARQKSGVQDARLNDTRAKALTDADLQGKNAQKLGGHTTPAMTQRYIRHRQTVLADSPSFNRSDGTKKNSA